MSYRPTSQCLIFVSLLALLSGCRPEKHAITAGPKTIVATYPILGSVVKDLVGDAFQVRSAIPDGADIHAWEPSAKDIEGLVRADLIVENGLGLEGGQGKALDQARKAGVPFFTAGQHIQVRHVGAGEGIPSDDPDQQVGAEDPHLWTDPLAVKAAVDALAVDFKQRFGVDLGVRSADLDARLVALDQEIQAKVKTLPPARRKRALAARGSRLMPNRPASAKRPPGDNSTKSWEMAPGAGRAPLV